MTHKPSLRKYRKVGLVLAEQATVSGVLRTPEGDMSYRPGDYIVCDSPPTHSWPVKREIFERTYELVSDDA